MEITRCNTMPYLKLVPFNVKRMPRIFMGLVFEVIFALIKFVIYFYHPYFQCKSLAKKKNNCNFLKLNLSMYKEWIIDIQIIRDFKLT